VRRKLGSFVLAFSLSFPAAAGHVFKVRGKLKSYTDKDITIIDTQGKKVKIPFTRLILEKNQDLSRMLDKETEFLYTPEFENAAMKGL